MSKPKLLVWSDFVAPTGFANVAKNLLNEAHKEWDVHIQGINYNGEIKKEKEWTVYPAGNSIDPKDVIGKIKELKPDLLFLFQDHYNIQRVIEALEDIDSKPPVVSYFPVDGLPLNSFIEDVVYKSDSLFMYTNWAKKVVKNSYPNRNWDKVKVLYHGVDTKVFKPLPIAQILAMKKFLGWEDKWVAVNVNRFQPRKQILSTLRAYSMFAKGYSRCSYCNHKQTLNLPLCERCGEDDLVFNKKAKKDVMLYLHMMPFEPIMGTTKGETLTAALYNTGFFQEDANKIISLNAQNIYKGEVSEDDINNLYNVANVNLSTTCGEGAGLSLLESKAVGTPSIASLNSAVPEMLDGTGTLVPIKGFFSMPNDNSKARPAVDEWGFKCALDAHYEQWKKSDKEKEPMSQCIDSTYDKFLWDDKRDVLMSTFREYKP